MPLSSQNGNDIQAITYYDKALAIDRKGTNMHYMIKQIHLIGWVDMQKPYNLL